MSAPDCLFCSIVAGGIPADIVDENTRALAFRDIDPRAPTHILVIPRDHHRDLAALAAADAEALVDVMALATRVAEGEGLAETGYRLVANTGSHGGQTVFHAHVHVLGGRPLAWPPG